MRYIITHPKPDRIKALVVTSQKQQRLTLLHFHHLPNTNPVTKHTLKVTVRMHIVMDSHEALWCLSSRLKQRKFTNASQNNCVCAAVMCLNVIIMSVSLIRPDQLQSCMRFDVFICLGSPVWRFLWWWPDSRPYRKAHRWRKILQCSSRALWSKKGTCSQTASPQEGMPGNSQ